MCSMYFKNRVVLVILIIILLQIINVNTWNQIFGKLLENNQDSQLNFTQLAGKYGYETEEHSVLTEDGYILKIFRIRGRQCEKNRVKRPVLLMHGLLLSADAFIDAGPRAGLAYLIADACLDLWVGNCRGTYYSQSHVTLDNNNARFWNFSVDEIGYYDVPATIDYILDKTGDVKVNYVGFSQGAGTVFIMCSERPGLCDKVNVLIALAPATRHTNAKSDVFRGISTICWKFENELLKSGIYEVFGKDYRDFFSIYCVLNEKAMNNCLTIVSLIDRPHPRSISFKTLKSLLRHFPAGTSLHNMARYGQSIASEHFEKFDYGAENINIYGTEEPPKYNLSAATMPVVVIYGENDGLVDSKDVEWLVSQLPNVVEAWLVPDSKWTHLDVMYSRYIPKLLFPKLHEYLLRY